MASIAMFTEFNVFAGFYAHFLRFDLYSATRIIQRGNLFDYTFTVSQWLLPVCSFPIAVYTRSLLSKSGVFMAAKLFL